MTYNSRTDFDFYKPSKSDIVLIIIILVFSLFSIFRFAFKGKTGDFDKKKVFVYQNGRLVQEIGLSKNREVCLFGGKLRVQVKDGGIRVIKADCPEHICMNMGWIDHSGQTIVCAPNKVLLEVKSFEPVSVDAVAY